jgi:hypothetical protein
VFEDANETTPPIPLLATSLLHPRLLASVRLLRDAELLEVKLSYVDVDVDDAVELGTHLVDICPGEAGRWPYLICQLNHASYSSSSYTSLPRRCSRPPEAELSSLALPASVRLLRDAELLELKLGEVNVGDSSANIL